MDKISLLIGSIIFLANGVISLLGFQIWSKYFGWKEVSSLSALGSLLLGFLLFYLYLKEKNK